MAKKQGSQLYNRQMCFFTGETLEQKPGAEVGHQADSRKETLNKAWSLCRSRKRFPWDSETWWTFNEAHCRSSRQGPIILHLPFILHPFPFSGLRKMTFLHCLLAGGQVPSFPLQHVPLGNRWALSLKGPSMVFPVLFGFRPLGEGKCHDLPSALSPRYQDLPTMTMSVHSATVTRTQYYCALISAVQRLWTVHSRR